MIWDSSADTSGCHRQGVHSCRAREDLKKAATRHRSLSGPVANDKGGVGKTTTAVSLASLLAERGRTLLVDADEKTASATEWDQAGPGLPCDVVSVDRMETLDLSPYAYIVFDTKAGEDAADLLTLLQAVDLLIVPTKPDALSLRALPRTLEPLLRHGATNYRVLITDVPPVPSTDGHEAWDVRRASAFNKAALAGIPVREVRGDTRACLAHMDYDLVLREILRCAYKLTRAEAAPSEPSDQTQQSTKSLKIELGRAELLS